MQDFFTSSLAAKLRDPKQHS